MGVVWSIAVACGMGLTMRYEATPGKSATASGDWPTGSRLRPATDRPTLVVMAHPQCPCTEATLSELNELLAQCPNKARVYVVFWKPTGYPTDWEKTPLWKSAAALPGVEVLTDEGGLEARRFHAFTSGQTFLFDASHHLVFSGGITAGRGHVGDNVGRDTIVSWLTTGKAKRNKTFVFGCSLFSPGSKNISP